MVDRAEYLYPTTFDAFEEWHDSMCPLPLGQPECDHNRFHQFPCCALSFSDHPHPNAIVNLFRTCHVMKCLPIAFHGACSRGTSSLFDGGENIELSREDLHAATVGAMDLFRRGYQKRNDLLECLEHCIVKNVVTLSCSRRQQKAAVARGIGRKVNRTVTPFECLRPRFKMSGFCARCLGQTASFDDLRREIWQDLPQIFQLPSWDGLNNDF